MNRLATFSAAALLGLLLSAGAEDSAPDAPRRPRIRSYNQKARILPLGDGAPSRDAEAGPSIDPNILRERSAQGDKQYGISQIANIPLLGPSAPAPAPETEEESDNWINPLDLLSEEELYNPEDLLVEEESDTGESNITEWENLQKDMIDRELENPREMAAEEASREEDPLGQQAEEERERPRVENTGLGLDTSAATVEAGTTRRDAEREAAAVRVQPPEALLESALRMDGGREPSRAESVPGDVEDPRDRELAGSRQLLDEVREKWRPANNFEVSANSAPSFSAPARAEVNPPPEAPSLRMRAVSLPSMDLARPGPEPSAPAAASLRPPAPEAPASIEMDRSRFRPDEFRIRSRLGETR